MDIVNKLSFELSIMLTRLGVLWKQSGARGFNDDLITYKRTNEFKCLDIYLNI